MTYMEYMEYKNNFIKAHNKSDWRVNTSPMDQYGQYVKNYIFDDGAVLTEINRPIEVLKVIEFEVKGITIKREITVKLFETEAWNTDDATSVKFYESY